MSTWRKSGPWAVRSYDAAIYARLSFALPTRWDWAARNLGMETPPVPCMKNSPGLLRVSLNQLRAPPNGYYANRLPDALWPFMHSVATFVKLAICQRSLRQYR